MSNKNKKDEKKKTNVKPNETKFREVSDAIKIEW